MILVDGETIPEIKKPADTNKFFPDSDIDFQYSLFSWSNKNIVI